MMRSSVRARIATLFRRGVPEVRQHDASDCGIACLASIAQYHGQRVSVARLRHGADTNTSGTSLLGLCRAAQRLGYTAKGIRTDPASLARAPIPAIAHIRLANGGYHFVVIDRVGPNGVRIMDPAGAVHRTESLGDFAVHWTGVLLLLAFTSAPPGTGGATGRRARVRRLVHPHRAALAQALFGALCYTLLGLATSIYVQQIVDSVLVDGRTGALRVMSVAMIAVAVAQTLIGGLRSALMLHIGQHIDAALILGYYNHLLRLPQSFFDRMRVGELTSRVTDAVRIRAFVGDVVVDAAANVLVVVASTAMMFLYDWHLAALVAAVLPLYACLYAIGSRLNHGQQRVLMERSAELEAQIVESLTSSGTVKRFALEAQAGIATEVKFVRLFRSIAVTVRTSIWLGGASQLIGRLGTIALLWLGTSRALAQQLTAGELMSCYALLGFLTGPALALVGFSKSLQEARVAGNRLFDIMDLEPEGANAPIPLVKADAGDVRFERVHFRYGARAPALIDVSFTCARGEITALVGESGSGKSTIAALLQRLYTVDHGRIRLGEHDIAHADLSALRHVVSVVPQQVDLFSGSILDNVALGDSTPDVRRVVRVCADVGLRDVIERMPQGWLTPVGERGVALSGGERQRLAIARAMYREPAVLVLDEATSALDSTNEQLVLDVMHRAAESGVTVIVIAHRLSTIRDAHHIIVLAGGRVAEEGDHHLLVEAGGPYARLWRQQHALSGEAWPRRPQRQPLQATA